MVSGDGKYAVASASSADNKDRWLVTIDPETGKTHVIDACTTMRGCARRRRDSRPASVEFLPDNKHVWFLSERDGWMHLYTLDLSTPARQA